MIIPIVIMNPVQKIVLPVFIVTLFVKESRRLHAQAYIFPDPE